MYLMVQIKAAQLSNEMTSKLFKFPRFNYFTGTSRMNNYNNYILSATQSIWMKNVLQRLCLFNFS